MNKFMAASVCAGLLALGATTGVAAQENGAAPAPAGSAVATAGIVGAPPEGKGQVVFFRKGGLFGAAISCAVHEKGSKISSLPPGRYSVIVAEPGIHEYSVKSEATDTLRLEIEPGETYFSQCTIGMGIMAGRPNLSPADQPTFDKMSKKLKPVENKG